jgi:hypothetical protein
MGHDPDDWFDEPEPADSWNARVDRIVRERAEREDWLRDEPAAAPTRRTAIRVNRAFVIVAVLALALLFGILAAAGVFSSSNSPATAPPPPTTTVHTPTTTAATTTQQQPTVTVPTTTLKPGDTGSEVVQLQKALTAAGHSPGKADGNYGPATTDAVKAFQAAKGLTADGVAGPDTLAALSTALQSG